MEEKKRRSKPFPKIRQRAGCTERNVIDLEKLREQYLDGPDYDWTPFCNRHGYDPRLARDKWKARGYDFQEWKREWLKRQAKIQDDELAPEILSLRKAVSHQRIKFVKDWTKRTEYMKTLLDAMLTRHGNDLQHDIQNTLKIQAGHLQPRFKLGIEELNYMAGAAGRLQEIETRALLLTGDKTQHAVITAGGEAEHREGPAELAAPEMHVATMGQSGLSAAETAKLLAKWFDQAEPKHVEEKPADADAKDNG